MVARTKSFSFKAVQEFVGKILILIAKRVLTGKTVIINTANKVNTVNTVNTECMQCEKIFSGEDELRKHIDAEHVLQISEDTENILSDNVIEETIEENVMRSTEKLKRKRTSSNESKSFSDKDILEQMNNAIKIVNNKREKLEEKVQLDEEVI